MVACGCCRINPFIMKRLATRLSIVRCFPICVWSNVITQPRDSHNVVCAMLVLTEDVAPSVDSHQPKLPRCAWAAAKGRAC